MPYKDPQARIEYQRKYRNECAGAISQRRSLSRLVNRDLEADRKYYAANREKTKPEHEGI